MLKNAINITSYLCDKFLLKEYVFQDTGLSNMLSQVLYDMKNIYDTAIAAQEGTSEETKDLYNKINTIYFITLQLMRSINTAIVKYNQIHNSSIKIITGLWDKSVIDDNIDLKLFLSNLKQSISSIEEN